MYNDVRELQRVMRRLKDDTKHISDGLDKLGAPPQSPANGVSSPSVTANDNRERAKAGDVVQHIAVPETVFVVGYSGSEYVFESPMKKLGTFMVKHGEYAILRRDEGEKPSYIWDNARGIYRPATLDDMSTTEIVGILAKREGVREIPMHGARVLAVSAMCGGMSE